MLAVEEVIGASTLCGYSSRTEHRSLVAQPPRSAITNSQMTANHVRREKVGAIEQAATSASERRRGRVVEADDHSP
jgi:hypothetical protein